VYLIDEVHMFSNHSFNALLKTLEEPPPHVKFLLATTEPRKIPVTILSRCLAFDLKRIGADLIAARLDRILAAEGIAGEPAATFAIARAADGSMRDALSLLDQCIAHGGGEVREADVRAMLGRAGSGQALALVRALAGGDAAVLFEAIEAIAEYAPDYEAILAEVIETLHRLAVCQALGRAAPGDAEIGALAEALGPEDCQLYYQIALIGRRDLALAPDPRRGFEMVMLRMLAFRRVEAEPGARLAVAPSAPPAAAPGQGLRRPAPRPEPEAGSGPAVRPAVAGEARGWQSLIEALGLSGLVRELAMHCVPAGEWRCGEVFRLSLPPGLAQIRGAKVEARLEEALRRHYGDPDLRLSVSAEGPLTGTSPAAQRVLDREARQAEARRAIAEDPHVKALREGLGAEIDEATIRPR
jgi:DNA polymerase-3 subunit gamma/tau